MDVRFYLTAAGNNPVIEHLREQPFDQRQLMGESIRILQTVRSFDEARADVRMDLKHVGDGLWEIRAGWQRVFYCVTRGPTIWLVHAARKDTEKTPQRVLEVARKRMNETLERSKQNG